MKFLRPLIALVLILNHVPSPADASAITTQMIQGQSTRVVKDQMLICYREGGRETVRNRIETVYGAKIIDEIEEIRVFVAQWPSVIGAQSYTQVAADDDVEFAEGNIVYSTNLTVNDPEFDSQDYLTLLGVPTAWDITTGVSSVVVAIIDTGVALTHPDLSANLWINPSPGGTSGLNGTATLIDWNGDGLCIGPDDAVAGPEQCAGDDPTDDHTGTFHGTHAAGIVAATADNATNIAGIAFNTRIMAVKSLNSSGFGTAASIADGITFATNNGASVISLSLGSASESATITAAANLALGQNSVLVAAAGNGSSNACTVNHPAAITRVIAVGATDINDNLASFSCTGPELDVVAPGVSILSTTSPTGTSSISGTSFSTPMVAAVAALLRSLDSNMAVDTVTQFINFNALDLGTAGFDNSFGFGRLRAAATVQAANDGTTTVSNPSNPNESFSFPNPFNPVSDTSTSISIPQSMGTNGLRIEIFTVSGKRVRTLTGTNLWDGRNDDGNQVASGLYFFYAETTSGDTKGKITVVK